VHAPTIIEDNHIEITDFSFPLFRSLKKCFLDFINNLNLFETFRDLSTINVKFLTTLRTIPYSKSAAERF